MISSFSLDFIHISHNRNSDESSLMIPSYILLLSNSIISDDKIRHIDVNYTYICAYEKKKTIYK